MYNHESILDLLWLCAISPPAFSSVTKNLFRFIPLLNIAFWASGQIFIDRRNRKTSVEALKKLLVRVHKQKRTVLISPEGTRTTTGDLLPFKKGGFYMAIEGQLPIHLVVIDGPFSLMPPGYASPLPGVLRLRYLPVIDTTTWKKETIPDHMTYVREIMRTSLIELRQAKKNQVLY
jgi:1-acyl-sn-glycerol-3-phosphate acyltransferase